MRSDFAPRGSITSAMETELTEPLMQWALSSHDPIVCNLGVEATEIFRCLHELSPVMHALLRRNPPSLPAQNNNPDVERICRPYLQLTHRLGSLLRDIRYWKEQAK